MLKYFSIINLIFNCSTFAQTKPIFYEADFGVNYVFSYESVPQDYFHPPLKIDRKIGYNFGFSTHYLLDERNNLWLRLGFIKSKINAQGFGSSYDWIMQAYPISIGYQHILDNSSNKFSPFVAINISYFYSTAQIKNIEGKLFNESDLKRSENGFGLDGDLGAFLKVSQIVDLVFKMKLSYANGSFFTEDSKYASIEFTGIYFNLGIKLNI